MVLVQMKWRGRSVEVLPDLDSCRAVDISTESLRGIASVLNREYWQSS